MEIKTDFRNNLLKRREIKFFINSESNPGIANAKKNLSDRLKISEETIAIKLLKNNFGSKNFMVEAFVYDSKEDLDKIEPKVKVKKTGENSGNS